MRQGLADAVHVLRAAVERVAAGAGIVIGNAAARLHCDGGEAVVVEREPGDVMRPGKGGLDRILIAHAHREGGVVGSAVMDQWRIGADRILGMHHRGQDLVIDRHQLRRIARLRFGRGDHDRDALADIAHAALRQRRALGAVALGPAHVLRHRPPGRACRARRLPNPRRSGRQRPPASAPPRPCRCTRIRACACGENTKTALPGEQDRYPRHSAPARSGNRASSLRVTGCPMPNRMTSLLDFARAYSSGCDDATSITASRDGEGGFASRDYPKGTQGLAGMVTNIAGMM